MRTQMRHGLAIAVLIVAGVTWAVVAVTAQGSRIQRGEELAPVPLNLNGLNPALVREGSYIVNAQGGCNDCHTYTPYAAGGDPFAGEPEQINAPCYLSGGARFGPFISRNLTLVPSRRTLDQFKQIMHFGTDFAGGATPILQVMPWPVYGKMSDRELSAIYEFLRAIPVIDPRPDACTQPPPPMP